MHKGDLSSFPRWGKAGMGAPRAKRSDGPNPQLPFARAEKRKTWGGQGQRSMPLLRDLTRCGCLSGVNAVNKASSAAPHQV